MEAELWQARLRDQLSRVQLSGQPQATRFMDPAQQQLARRLLAQFPDVPAVFEGGVRLRGAAGVGAGRARGAVADAGDGAAGALA